MGFFVIMFNGFNIVLFFFDISYNFDRSFIVGDVFMLEKKMYVELCSLFLIKGSVFIFLVIVKLFFLSVWFKYGGVCGGWIFFLGGGSFGVMWFGSFLVFIFERSVNDEVGEMDVCIVGLFGNKIIGFFWDGIEINIFSV